MIERDSISRNTERYIEGGMFEIFMMFITLLNFPWRYVLVTCILYKANYDNLYFWTVNYGNTKKIDK